MAENISTGCALLDANINEINDVKVNGLDHGRLRPIYM